MGRIEKTNLINEKKGLIPPPHQITFYDREKEVLLKEKVYGEALLNWLYQTKSGSFLIQVLTRPLVSKAYGHYQDSSLSKRKIGNFIRDFDIKMDEYLPEDGRSTEDPYSSFNQFFIRKFKKGMRPFAEEEKSLAAFAEGRYLGFEKISPQDNFPVKGEHMSAQALLNNEKWNKVFAGGPLLICRLCPVDYHRFHFPGDGQYLDFYKNSGPLHSVNPLALKLKSDIFCTNERHISILESKSLGRLAYIEIGAICVGRIVQFHDSKQPFKRGDEKGTFLFGGSTVLLLGEPGAWTPDQDILKRTAEKVESFVKLGERIASKL